MHSYQATDIHLLVGKLFNSTTKTFPITAICNHCHDKNTRTPRTLSNFSFGSEHSSLSLNNALKQLASKCRGPLCPRCKHYSYKHIHFSKDSPSILCLTPWPGNNSFKVNQELTLGDDVNKVTYKLRGIIYHGHNHFTCRYVTKSRQVYYHDGLKGHEFIHDGSLSYISNNDSVHNSRDMQAVLFLYSAL